MDSRPSAFEVARLGAQRPAHAIDRLCSPRHILKFHLKAIGCRLLDRGL